MKFILLLLFFQTVCPNMTTFNESSGVITSPFYPRYYPDNQACSWQITASKGKRVQLVIEYTYIQSCGSSCTCDYLVIQSGAISGDNVEGGRICGYYSGKINYLSFSESLTVLFVCDSSSSKSYRGFRATYKHVNYTASGKK